MIGVVDTSALIRLFVPDGPLPDGFNEFLRGVERGFNKSVAGRSRQCEQQSRSGELYSGMLTES